MINYKRRSRQASEDSDIIIERFAELIQNNECLYPGNYNIKSDADLMKIIEEVRKIVQEKASRIQPDWSVPIILEAIGKLYYGKKKEFVEYGPTFKRALVYLWKASESSFACQKSLRTLEEVLRLCFVLEGLYGYRRFFLISEEFQFELKEGYCRWEEEFNSMIYHFAKLIQGRGKRMRVAEVNSHLMCRKSNEFFSALIKVLDGESPQRIAVFQNSFYEKIPSITECECKRFWQSVFFRYSFFMAAMADEICIKENEIDWDPKVMLFHEFGIELPENLLSQEIVKETFWNREWVDSQDDERYSNLIVERPILRITPEGDFATCSVLIGDSVNYFIESQIFNYSFRSPRINLPSEVFKNAFSAPFEDLVIAYFRELGFEAGHVTEEGVWKVQASDIILKVGSDIRLYGEIDALAYNPRLNFAILAECKVLNDVRDYRSYKNIVAKLVDDSEGFQCKLLEKSKWVNKALSNKYNVEVEAVCAILTDIPLPIIEFPNEEIYLMDFKRFFEVVAELLEKYI